MIDYSNLPNEAPLGYIWMCAGCGKTARNRVSGGKNRGWDVSCSMYAVLMQDGETSMRNSNTRSVNDGIDS